MFPQQNPHIRSGILYCVGALWIALEAVCYPVSVVIALLAPAGGNRDRMDCCWRAGAAYRRSNVAGVQILLLEAIAMIPLLQAAPEGGRE